MANGLWQLHIRVGVYAFRVAAVSHRLLAISHSYFIILKTNDIIKNFQKSWLYQLLFH